MYYVYFLLVSPITVSILGMRKFPTGLSILLLANVISIFCLSLASGLESVMDAQPYMVYKMFTGTTYVTGGFFLLALKIKLTGGLIAKI